jgi:molybdate transport system substrate-binding protein
MHIAGTEIVGPLPGDLNMVTTFAAGIWLDSKQIDAAKTLVEFLHSAESARCSRQGDWIRFDTIRQNGAGTS